MGMRDRAILPLVLSMSLPMVLSMLVNSLYNIIDSYFVAQIMDSALTALSLVYPLQILVTAVSVGFGIGINATASFYLGAQEYSRANDTVSLGILLSFVHGMILTAGCCAGIPYFLKAFTADPIVIEYGLQYSYIVFAFCPVIAVGIAFEKVFQAEGQMQISMISMLSGCIVNIILDPLMIFGIGPFPEMGITGAAWATGIGQVVPLLVYLLLYWKKDLPLRMHCRRSVLDASLCKKLYAVGVPAAMNMALPSVLITVLNGILSSFSDMYVLVLGIYFKLRTFIYLVVDGIVQGIRPIVGYNYGAKQADRVRQTFQTALALAVGVMAFGTVICLAGASNLIGIFTETPEVIAAGRTALTVISMGFIVSSVSLIVSGTLEGLGKGMPSLLISLMRNIIVIIPLAFLLSGTFGVTGVWHSFWTAEILTALAALVLYRQYIVKRVLKDCSR